MQFRFNKVYFLVASALLAAEFLIALFLHDKIIRPYGGDVLAPIFLYCLVRSCCVVSAGRAAGLVLLVSYLLEILQHLQVLSWLGWQHVRWVAVLLGSHFEWADLLAYTGGVALVLLAERVLKGRPVARNEWQGSTG